MKLIFIFLYVPMNISQNITTKIFILGMLIIGLAIPVQMVRSLVHEREQRYDEAVYEVSQKWGNEQAVIGPILSVPYEVLNENDDIVRSDTAYFLPENIEYNVDLQPESRERGFFDVLLYTADIRMSGNFQPLFDEIENVKKNVLWDQAKMSLILEDSRRIQAIPQVTFEGVDRAFEPSQDAEQIIASHLGLDNENVQNPFAITLSLRGSKQFMFTPVGKETKARVSSSWQHPGFSGYFLPTNHETTENGFQADWNISYFGKSFPQQWRSQGEESSQFLSNMYDNAVITELHMPVDYYHKIERSIKYAIMFIMLIFVTFFLFEVLSKLRLHPIQYLFVGLAMCVFYVLLISLTEHIGLWVAYLISSLATTGLISVYCASVLKQKKRSLVIAGLLVGVYSYLYVLLQSRDHSLLMGSIFLFIALAVIMYLTRDIDWYAVSSGNTSESTSKNK